MDSDDWVDVDYVEILCKRMLLYKVDLVVTSFIRESEKYSQNVRLSGLANGYYRIDQEGNVVLPTLIWDNNGISRSIEVSRGGKIFKTSLLQKNLDYFREDIDYGEDGVMILAYALDCASIYIHADTYLYHYRVRSGSATMTYRADQYFRLDNLYEYLERICVEKSSYNFAPQFRLKCYHTLINYIRKDVDCARPKLRIERFRAVQRMCRYYNGRYNLYPPQLDIGEKTNCPSVIDFCMRQNLGTGVYLLEYVKSHMGIVRRFVYKQLCRNHGETNAKQKVVAVCDPVVCTGCGACAVACPTGALQMEADAQGFLYPRKDQAHCMQCGLCEQACPVCGSPKGREALHVYGCKHVDSAQRSKSTSGGAFGALTQWILEQDGVVYGAVLQDDNVARHVGVSTKDGVEQMKGSKYVQSELGAVFKEIRQVLEQRPVLFSGTPCQVAGLKGYSGRI